MAVLDLGLGLGLPRNKKSNKGVSLIPGASIQADFTRNFIVGAPRIDIAFPITRSTSGKADDLSLNWTDFIANTLRRTNRGIRCEEARTNSLRNSTYTGAVGGTIGSGGAMPNFWQFSAPSGIALQALSSGVGNGVEKIRFRASGTAAAAGTILIAFEGVQQVAASMGQTWTSSFFFAKISGNDPSGGYFNIVTGRNSGGSYVEGNGSNGLVFSPTAGVLARTPHAHITLANASSVFVRNGLNMVIASGENVDITFEVGWPQLELGWGVTSPIRTTTVAVTRNGDFTTLLNPNTNAGISTGWVFIEWEDLVSPNSPFRRLWRYRKDGNNAMEMNIGQDGRVSFGSTVAGVAQISNLLSTNVTVAGGIYKAAFRFAANNYNAKFSSNLGAQPVIGTNGTLPDLTGATLGIGNVGTDSGQPNCNIRAFACGSGLKTDAELLAMVA